MRLKSYFSGTVEAALELARRELGEDALLVNARPAAPEMRYLGAYEVVFGVVESARPDRGDRPPAANRLADRAAPAGIALEFAGLKREFERMAQRLEREEGARAEPAPVEQPLYSRLIEQDLDPALARMVVQGAPIESLFEGDSTLGTAGGSGEDRRAIVAFVGPPGAGKTAALVKIAARFGLDARKPAQILSTDVHRCTPNRRRGPTSFVGRDSRNRMRCRRNTRRLGSDVGGTSF